jgi:hypothetical protein
MKFVTALACVVILGLTTLKTVDVHEENPQNEEQKEETLAIRPPIDPRNVC